MNVLVCFKPVPEVEKIHESDWRLDQGQVADTRFVKTVINPLDESALEIALKLRDQAADKLPGGVHLYAMCLAGPEAEQIIKTLYALKFDRVLRLESVENQRFRPELTATVLAEAARAYLPPLDLIMGGAVSADDGGGATMFFMAEELKLPCLSNILGLGFISPGIIDLERKDDDGVLRQKVKTPVLLTVGNAPSTYLRVPTLKDRLAVGIREIETINLDGQFAPPEPHLQLTALKRVINRREGQRLNGADAKEKAAILYSRYLKDMVAK